MRYIYIYTYIYVCFKKCALSLKIWDTYKIIVAPKVLRLHGDQSHALKCFPSSRRMVVNDPGSKLLRVVCRILHASPATPRRMPSWQVVEVQLGIHEKTLAMVPWMHEILTNKWSIQFKNTFETMTWAPRVSSIKCDTINLSPNI